MSFTKFVSVAALAAVAAAQNTTYIVTQTSVETITHCEETVTDCPALNHNGTAFVTHTNTITVTDCPPESKGSDSASSAPAPGPKPDASPAPAPGPKPDASPAPAPAPAPEAAGPSGAKESVGSDPSAENKPADPTHAPAPAPAPTDDDKTTFVTVEEGITVTVVGTKSHSTGVAEVPETYAPVEANAAAAMSFGGAAALVAGALLL